MERGHDVGLINVQTGSTCAYGLCGVAVDQRVSMTWIAVLRRVAQIGSIKVPRIYVIVSVSVHAVSGQRGRGARGHADVKINVRAQ